MSAIGGAAVFSKDSNKDVFQEAIFIDNYASIRFNDFGSMPTDIMPAKSSGMLELNPDFLNTTLYLVPFNSSTILSGMEYVIAIKLRIDGEWYSTEFKEDSKDKVNVIPNIINLLSPDSYFEDYTAAGLNYLYVVYSTNTL